MNESTPDASSANELQEWMLQMLRCPLTHSPLRRERDREGEWLVAEVGGLRYPVRDGIPAMLVEEARLPAGVKSLDELKQQLGLK
jgi:uncharacterized protein